MSSIKLINPESLRVPTKAYSNGLLLPLGVADLMFVTGQLSQDAEGNVVYPNNAEGQAKIIFDRISAILSEAGMSLDNVVKAQIFVTNIADAPAVSKVRNEVFNVSRPVSTLVEVNALDKDECCVEIEVIAARMNTNA
ncbi:MAG: RidA family protein [Pyrinomonadaceae bacterium]